MKLLILDFDYVMLAMALRAAKAGHEVRIWFGSKTKEPETGRGFKDIKIVSNWLGSARWADMILPSGNNILMPKLDQLRKAGMKVFGPTEASADLEVKRAEGMQFFEAAGIEVPPYKKFKKLSDAEAHVRKTGQKYVFKTLGDEEDKSLTYVGKSPADLIARMQRWEKLGMQPKGEFILQEVVEGIEFGVSRWMGSDGFLGIPNENFEMKKLCSGNAGPSTGESGTVAKYVAKSKLYDDVLKPMEKALKALRHTGDIDVNCIVDDKGKAYPLEFTARFGWPFENLALATTQGDPVQWMLDALDGKDSLKVVNKVACGVVLAQPDYPYSNRPNEETTGIPIYGVTKDNKKYLYPQSVTRMKLPDMEGDKIVDSDIWATSGDYVLVVTGTGRTVSQACSRCYDTMSEIKIADGIWRDDIGERLEEELPRLQEHGYATGFEY